MGNIFSQAAVNKNLSLSMHMNMAIASGWNRTNIHTYDASLNRRTPAVLRPTDLPQAHWAVTAPRLHAGSCPQSSWRSWLHRRLHR